MRCHGLHAQCLYPAAVAGMRSALPRLNLLRPPLPPGRKQEGSLCGGRSVLPKLRSCPSCMSFLHPVSFYSLPFFPPPGLPGRRDPNSRVSCAGARFAPARFARLIARPRPGARAGRKAYLTRCLNRGLFCAGASGETKRTRGCHFLLPAQSSDHLENFNPYVELFHRKIDQKRSSPMPCPRRRDTPGSPHTPVRIISAAFSPIMMEGALVLPEVRVGMIEASATRRPSMPWTRSRSSTTAIGSEPILQVPTGW